MHLHTRMNRLPYLHKAGQALMMRLIFKLSSKLSFFISFTSATSKRLKPQLRHESIFLLLFSGPIYYLFEKWPSKTWAPTHRWVGISLPPHTTSEVNPVPPTQLLCPPSHSQSEDSLTFIPRQPTSLQLRQWSCPAPASSSRLPSSATSRIQQLTQSKFPLFLIFFFLSFFWWIQTDQFLGSLTTTQEPMVVVSRWHAKGGTKVSSTYRFRLILNNP